MQKTLLLGLLFLGGWLLPARAQNTAFSYQGFLTENGGPANGVFDLQFRLLVSSNALGFAFGTVVAEDLPASNGVFTARLDFGATPFSGPVRWLEIGVRPGASRDAFTILSPLQPVTPTPYAITALGAAAGSIGSAALADGAVTGAKLASNSITSASLADGSVTSNKLAAGAVTALQLAKPYEAGIISSYDYFFRLEQTQPSRVRFNTDFQTLPSVALNLETLDEALSESAFPRTDNRSSSGFDLKFRITNRLDSIIARADIGGTFLGLDSAMIGGRPAVALASVGCSISAIPSTNQTITEKCWLTIGKQTGYCGNPPVPCVIDVTLPVSCDQEHTFSTFVTNVVVSTNFTTNCSSPLLFARASDVSGSSWHVITVSALSAAAPSLAVINGTPTIAFYSSASGTLRVVDATTSSGSNWNGSVLVANHADVGRFLSLAQVNGRAAMSYFNASSNDLEYVRFNGVNWSSRVSVDSLGQVGEHNSLAVVNDRPAIACFRSLFGGNGNLVYYRANDANGNTWGTRITVDTNIGDLGAGPATTNGSVISLLMIEDRPAIAYYHEAENVMKFVRSTDTNGATWGTPIPITSLGSSFGGAVRGGSCRLAVLNGLPTLQYAAGPDVFVATARNSFGTSWDSPSLIANGGTTTAQAGGLVTTEGQYASAVQVYRPSGSTASQVLYTRRAPSTFAISWIAVQP